MLLFHHLNAEVRFYRLPVAMAGLPFLLPRSILLNYRSIGEFEVDKHVSQIGDNECLATSATTTIVPSLISFECLMTKV